MRQVKQLTNNKMKHIYLLTIQLLSVCYLCESSSISNPKTNTCIDGKCTTNFCGQKTIKNDTAVIINGTQIKTLDYPWHVGIHRNEVYVCGGTIIAPKIIMSAAHCFIDVNDKLYNLNSVTIGAGKYYQDINSPFDVSAQIRKVAKVEFSNYGAYDRQYDRDFCLVILKDALNFNNFVQPVCVDWNSEFENEQLKTGSNGVITGWGGDSEELAQENTELNQFTVPFIDREKCLNELPKTFLRYFKTDKFCSGYMDGKSMCNGYGGSGLVFERQEKDKSRYYIRGIASLVPANNGTCNKKLYTYTRVSLFMDFIKEVESQHRN